LRARDDAVLAKRDCLDIGRRRQRGEHDGRGARNGGGRVGPDRAGGHERIGRGAPYVVHHEGIARLLEIARHARAHRAEPDEADLGLVRHVDSFHRKFVVPAKGGDPDRDSRLCGNDDQRDFATPQIIGLAICRFFGHTVRSTPDCHSTRMPALWMLSPSGPYFTFPAGTGRLVNSVVASTSRSFAPSRLAAFSSAWRMTIMQVKPTPSCSLPGCAFGFSFI